MNDGELDAKLAVGRDAVSAPVMTRELVGAASAAARRQVDAERPHRRPRRIAWIAAIVGTGALVSIAGTTAWVSFSNPTAIPVSYVANDGSTVRCEYVIGNAASSDPEVVAEWEEAVAAVDWNGIGQEAHDDAVANPYVPGPNDDLDDASPAVMDWFSWNRAFSAAVDERLPSDLPDGFSYAGSSTCSGKL